MGGTNSQFSLDKALISIFAIVLLTINFIPYFPSTFPTHFPSEPTSPSPLHRHTCLSFLHSVRYYDHCCEGNKRYSWEWVQSYWLSACGFHHVHKAEASTLVNGSWVVVAGDSACRLAYISLLEIFVGSQEIRRVKVDFIDHHTNYSKTVDDLGLKMDFLWRPLAVNLTLMMSKFKETGRYPDLIILGAEMWDMLYINNPPLYGRELAALRNAYLALPGARMPVFWLGLTTLVNHKLNTATKKARFKDPAPGLYDDQLRGSGLLRQSGGAMFLLDLGLLSDLCGEDCAADGMHYDASVYDAAVQIMLNVLAIRLNKNIQP